MDCPKYLTVLSKIRRLINKHALPATKKNKITGQENGTQPKSDTETSAVTSQLDKSSTSILDLSGICKFVYINDNK